jgi:hypothetical protein
MRPDVITPAAYPSAVEGRERPVPPYWVFYLQFEGGIKVETLHYMSLTLVPIDEADVAGELSVDILTDMGDSNYISVPSLPPFFVQNGNEQH